MSEHVAILILDVKHVVGLETVGKVRQLLSDTTFAELFACQFQPLLLTDLSTDIPDLCDLGNLLVLGLDSGADREDFVTAVKSIADEDQQRYLASFTLISRLVELVGINDVDQQHSLFKAWVALKLAVSVWQYWQENGVHASWTDYDYLDVYVSEDESEDESEDKIY